MKLTILINPYTITKYIISPFKYHIKYYYDYNNYQYHLSQYQEVKQAVTFNLNSIQANDAKKCNTKKLIIFLN